MSNKRFFENVSYYDESNKYIDKYDMFHFLMKSRTSVCLSEFCDCLSPQKPPKYVQRTEKEFRKEEWPKSYFVPVCQDCKKALKVRHCSCDKDYYKRCDASLDVIFMHCGDNRLYDSNLDICAKCSLSIIPEKDFFDIYILPTYCRCPSYDEMIEHNFGKEAIETCPDCNKKCDDLRSRPNRKFMLPGGYSFWTNDLISIKSPQFEDNVVITHKVHTGTAAEEKKKITIPFRGATRYSNSASYGAHGDILSKLKNGTDFELVPAKREDGLEGECVYIEGLVNEWVVVPSTNESRIEMKRRAEQERKNSDIEERLKQIEYQHIRDREREQLERDQDEYQERGGLRGGTHQGFDPFHDYVSQKFNYRHL